MRSARTAELDLGDEKYEFKPAELAMAKQLVSAMTGEFDPAQYKDEYREALESVIQAKVEGKETVAVEAPEETGKLIDLMAALEASVNAAKEARESSGQKPVSVADAKAAKAEKASKTTAAAKAKANAARGRRRGAGQARPEAQDRLRGGVGAGGRRAAAAWFMPDTRPQPIWPIGARILTDSSRQTRSRDQRRGDASSGSS